jgi:peptidoglycan/LPS O-acetylase OafA/YrhL
LNRIPSLDGFRAISILLILFCHSRLAAGFPQSATLIDIARQSEVGVTVFFVISGFLITYLLLDEEGKNGTISLKAFYTRRAFRILPVYFLYVAFILVLRNFETMGLTQSNLIHVFTFTVNFDRQKDWFLGHFWSLSVEEQFYLFWPAMLLLFRRHLKVALVVLIAYSCIVRVVAYKLPQFSTVAFAPFFAYSDAIFIGAFGGILFFESPRLLKHQVFRSYLAQATALCLFLLFVYCTEHGKLGIIALPFGNTIISLSALFLIIAYIFPSDKIIYKMLNSKIFVHIGILSYSIYIWQEFFFLGEVKGFWRTFPYNILVIYLVSLVSYYLWEQPFLKVKKRFSMNKLQPNI